MSTGTSRVLSSMRNLALLNCRIVEGQPGVQPVDGGVILIRNVVSEGEKPGRIAAIGHAGDIQIPGDYRQLDLGGRYVLPGFINAHCHLFGSGKPSRLVRLMSEHEVLVRRMIRLLKTPAGKPIVWRMMVANARNALYAGVTTVRAMGDMAYLDVRLRKRIDQGKAIGPRVLASGYAVVPTGGHGGYVGVTADSPTEIRKMVRTNIREEVDWIKIISTGGVMDARRLGEAGQPQMTVQEIETACVIAHRAGLMVATHCESTKGMEEALLGGVDTIEHGAEIPDELVPLFKHNPKALRGYTALVPTLSAAMGIATLPVEVTKISRMSFVNALIVEQRMIRGLQRAYQEGIPIAVGTDASVPYVAHYDFWKELLYYVHYTGMSAQEAIHFATLGTAQVLGIDDETGSLEVGKSADLQVVDGNPLADLRHLAQVSAVVVRGHLVEHPRVKRIKALDRTPVAALPELPD